MSNRPHSAPRAATSDHHPSERRPVVGIPACSKFFDPHPFYAVGEKYVDAVADGADTTPLLIPPLGPRHDEPSLVASLDGLFLSGSPSNVWPDHYGGPASKDGTLHDHARDSTTLPLIRAALGAGMPLLAVCRGIQELNVALGGTLHQEVHEQPGRDDHREPKGEPLDIMYGPAHAVDLVAGGALATLFGCTTLTVNSLHSQGIDRLADGLVVEATAHDGQIEAVRVVDAPAFAIGVQWHPEWQFAEDPASRTLFRAFGAACRAYAADKAKFRTANPVPA